MAKGYLNPTDGQVFCATCLRSYVKDGALSKADFELEATGLHCNDCWNCIGHDKRYCSETA